MRYFKYYYLWRCVAKGLKMKWIISLFLFVLINAPSAAAEPMLAQAIVATSSVLGVSKRLGTVLFTQNEYGGPVRITGELSDMPVDEAEVGIHIHSYGNLSQGCDSAGPHFNPDRQQHGGPNDEKRHVGDLGNVKIVNRKCTIDITDKRVQLTGPHSIVGRSLVIHVQADDFGKGGNEESSLTGNVGRAQACGIIGLASDFLLSPPSSTDPTSSSTRIDCGAALVAISLVFSLLRNFVSIS